MLYINNALFYQKSLNSKKIMIMFAEFAFLGMNETFESMNDEW